MQWFERSICITGLVAGVIGIVFNGLAVYGQPASDVDITYGVTFSAPYATSLGLDWRKAYGAVLTDLGAKHLRLVAYWSEIEGTRGTFDFSKLDEQIAKAATHDADIILAVGRRVPRWPECHVPEWASDLTRSERQTAQLAYMERVITRYKDEPHIIFWQVENEPYLEVFAVEHCGELDEDFLREEIARTRSLDPDTPVLITDSGNLGTWWRPYRLGDAFGTSVYRYFWHPDVGPFTSILPATWYRTRHAALDIAFGDKPFFLIELAGEPWLTDPLPETPVETQLERMNPVFFDETIAFARETGFTRQYLWGVEWWYWLKENHSHPELWDRARGLFRE